MVVAGIVLILDEEDVIRHRNRRRVPILVEPEAIGANLLLGEGQGRVEATQEGIDSLQGNLPDAEEAQDVVDAVGIEVLGHLHKACLPPGKAVLGHLLPIVGREAPVLTHHREIIGRSTRRRVHVEELGIDPGIDTRARDTNRNIALQHHATRVGVVAHLAQLTVEVELHEVVVGHLFGVGSLILDSLLGRVVGPLAPLLEIGGRVGIAQGAEDRVGAQPMLVRGHEGLELLRGEALLALLQIECAEVFVLRIIDLLVVDFGEGIQLAAQLLEAGCRLLVLELAHIRQVQELRVQGEGRVGVVGVGVLPSAGHRRIVHGQNLDNRLTRRGGPINHQLQVVELAHTEAVVRAQGKDRNGHTGTAPGIHVEAGTQRVNHHALALLQRTVEEVVLAGLPSHGLTRCGIDNDELVGKGGRELLARNVGRPYGGLRVAHHHALLDLPVAQHLLVAHQDNLLRGANHGNLGANHHLVGRQRGSLLRLRAGKDTLGEHRRAE